MADSCNLPYADASFEVILSSGTLVCVGPKDIRKAVAEIGRVAARWVVVAEPHCDVKEKEDPYPNARYWLRDYSRYFPFRVIRSLRIPEPLDHIDSITVMEKA